MDRKKLELIVLGLIIILGSCLRLSWLRQSPPSVNWDEAALGYNAYSLWKTGKDEFGHKLPLSLRSFDDYKPPLYSYLTAPIVGIFGLNEFTTRFLSAISGIFSILLIYLITQKLFADKRIALLSAFLVAIEPWAIFYSRGAWEGNLSLTLFLISVWLWLLGKKNWSLLFTGINVFAYHSAKIYLPLWVLLSLREWKQSKLGIFIAVTALSVSIFGGSGFARLESTRLKNLGEIGQRYLSYFSPANLFVRGTNENNQRVDGWGLFYVWEIVFWAIGIGWLLKNWQKNKELIIWLALAPLPAIITWSWFNPIRVMPLWAVNSILISKGLFLTWSKLKRTFSKVIFVSGLGGWIILNMAWFFLSLLWMLPYFHYGDWQWGFREVVKEIAPIIDKYDKVIWETSQAQPHIFVLFYLQYPPEKYQQEIGNVPSPRKNFDFGKFEFRKIYWPTDQDLKKTIFIGGVYSLPEELAIKHVFDPQDYESARIVVRD